MKKYKIVLPIMLSILVPLFITGCNSKKEAEVKGKEVVSAGSTTDNKDASQVNTTTDNKDTSSGATTVENNNENAAGSKDNNSTSTDKNNASTNANSSTKTNAGSNANTGTTPASNSKIIIDVKAMDKSGTFPFGMSKDNVTSKLKDLKLPVQNEVEITNSKNSAEYGNKQIWAEGISFSFDKNNQLYSINVNGNIATSLGLKVGASTAEMEKLYGKDYVKFSTSTASGYEYTFGDHYFRVFVEGDKITEWAVSKYKLAK